MSLPNQTLKKANQLIIAKQYNKAIHIITPLLQNRQDVDILVTAYALLGKSFYKTEAFDLAIEHFQKAIQLSPEDDRLYYYIGITYLALNHLLSAEESFQKAILLNPNRENYFLNLGATCRHLEKLDSAEKCYRSILALSPNSTKAYRNMSLCIRYESIDHPDRHHIEQIMQHQKLSNEEKAQCYFSLGKIFRDCNIIDKAIDYYSVGNFFKHKTHSFNVSQYTQKIDSIIKLFPESIFSVQREASEQTPIFIIGIPRSGKTLVEKCLSKHKMVFALEEFGMIDKLVFNSGRENHYINLFSDMKRDLTIALTENLAKHYKKQMAMRARSYLKNSNFSFRQGADSLSCAVYADVNEQHKKNCNEGAMKNGIFEIASTQAFDYFTDTTPCNFRYLGFIAMMFPNAKIIHVVRDPLDHILQIFFKYFSTGNFWAYDIANIVQYYIEYRRIMTYWEKTLPLDIKTIQYESLIQDSAKTIEDIYEFTGLGKAMPEEMKQFQNRLHDNEIYLWQQYQNYFSQYNYHLEKLKLFS